MEEFAMSQKQKLLFLQKILNAETDEQHTLTVKDIITKLGLVGIKAERKTVYDDLEMLRDFGMDICDETCGHAKAYYVGARLFQDEELMVLCDAVASSKFLTQKKSEALIKKLGTLTSRYKAPSFMRNIYISNRSKTFNESIYYAINTIHDAINAKKRITFHYCEYDINKKKIQRGGGALYSVSPYFLRWESDNYYLSCWCDKHNKLTYYRVDRMEDVEVSEEKARAMTIDEEAHAKSMAATYGMFVGRSERVTFEMAEKLINVVIDRYGEKVIIHRKTEDVFQVTLEVQISPTFWGWLFQFGNQAKIVAPDYMVETAREEIQKLARIYD